MISHRYFPDVATKDNFSRNAPRARSDQAFGSIPIAMICHYRLSFNIKKSISHAAFELATKCRNMSEVYSGILIIR